MFTTADSEMEGRWVFTVLQLQLFFFLRLKMYFNKFRLHYFISQKNFKGTRDKSNMVHQ